MIALSEAQRASLEAIRARHGLRLILAFGSRVKGRVHGRSDLDVGVLGARRQAFDTLGVGSLAADLAGVFPDVDVDIAILNGADPLLLGEVSDACELLAGEAVDLHEFRMYAFRARQDHGRWLALEARTNERRLAVT